MCSISDDQLGECYLILCLYELYFVNAYRQLLQLLISLSNALLPLVGTYLESFSLSHSHINSFLRHAPLSGSETS